MRVFGMRVVERERVRGRVGWWEAYEGGVWALKERGAQVVSIGRIRGGGEGKQRPPALRQEQADATNATAKRVIHVRGAVE
jgi:hypothetical protein